MIIGFLGASSVRISALAWLHMGWMVQLLNSSSSRGSSCQELQVSLLIPHFGTCHNKLAIGPTPQPVIKAANGRMQVPVFFVSSPF